MLTFQDQLKRIYQSQNQIIPLIQGLEDEIPQQLLENDYIKLRMSIRQGENLPNVDITDLETIFDLLPNEEIIKRAINKLLIVGGAGTGKSTLTQYIAYRWSQGELWNDKFDYVYRVSLKTLLTRGWDYNHGHGRQDEDDDLLKQLVYYHLRTIAGEFCKLEDMPWKKDRTLLLLDGFDEVAHEMNGIYKTLFESMLDYENLIITSRPNAVGKDMTYKFNRIIENRGFDPAGINEYLTKYFENNKKKGQAFEEYLAANSFIKEACHNPVIIALLCFIWSEGDSNQALQKVSNISDLYHQVVDHLGWRYYANQTSLSEQDRYELLSKWRGGDIPLDDLLVLQHTAYKRMTGGGIEAPGDQRPETLLIPGSIRKGDKHGVSIQSSIYYLTDELKRGMPTINKVYKYGLLKVEGPWITNKKPSETDLQYYNFSFIHQSFQEFLAAQYLVKKLVLNEKRESIANFIAQHRNEPYYLNTLKFMAGIFSTAMKTAKDENVEEGFLVFWDAIMCNPDGILEFGEEMKVTLLMHLLTQTTKEEKKKLNMDVAVRLIDNVVLRNLSRWSIQLRESDYLSNNMREVLIEHFLPSQKVLRTHLKEKIDVTMDDLMKIISVMVHKFPKEEQEEVFERVLEFLKGHNEAKWQERKKSIDAIIAFCRKSDLNLDEFSQEQLSHSLFVTVYDDNLREVSLRAIQELAIKPQNLFFVEKLQSFLKEEFNVRIDAEKLLILTDLIPVANIQDNQLIETIIKSLIPLLKASSRREGKLILDKIKGIVKISYKNNSELVRTTINSLTPVADNSNQSLKALKLDTITELTKIGWKNDSELIKNTLRSLDPFLKDLDWAVRKSASDNMTKLTKLGWKKDPQLIKRTLESLTTVFQDAEWQVRKSASGNFLELVKGGYENDHQLIEYALNSLAQFFKDPNPHVKKSAAEIVIELVKAGGVNDALLFKNTFTCLMSTFLEKSDDLSREKNSSSARKLIRISCKDNAQLSLEFLKYLALIFKTYDSGQTSCSKIVTELIDVNESSYNQLVRDMLRALIPLLQNYHDSVRETAFNSIGQLMEINDKKAVQLVLKNLTQLLEYPDFNVRNSVLDTVIKFVEKNGNDSLQLAGNILKNSDWNIRHLSSKAIENLEASRSRGTDVIGILDELSKQLRNYDLNLRNLASGKTKLLIGVDANIEARTFNDLFKVLTSFLNSSDASTKNSASETIITLMKISDHCDTRLLEDLFEALKSVLQDFDATQRKSAFENFKALLDIRSLHPELVEKFWKELAPLLINSTKEVRLLVSDLLTQSMTFSNRRDDVYAKRVGDLLNNLRSLLEDSSEEIHNSARRSLQGLIEIHYSECTHLVRDLFYNFSRLIVNPHLTIRDIAFSSIQELVKMNQQGQIQFAAQALDKFKPRLLDQNVDIENPVFQIIINLTKMEGLSDAQIFENVLKRLTPLLQHQGWRVQHSALGYVTELIKTGRENGILNTLQIQKILNNTILPLFKDQSQIFRKLVSDKVIELAALGQENDSQFIREIFEGLALLLIDPDRDIKTQVSDCMAELVKIGSQKDAQFTRYALDSLIPVFKEFNWQIKEPVSVILIETINKSPQYDHTELCQTLFTFLTSLLGDSNWCVRSSAADKIIKLLKLNYNHKSLLVREAIETSIALFQHANPNVVSSCEYFLERIFLQILSRDPTDLIEYFNHSSKKVREILISSLFDCLKNYVQNFELLEQFFKDPKDFLASERIKRKLFKGDKLERIILDIQSDLEKLQNNELTNIEFDERFLELKSQVVSELNQIDVLKGPQIIELAMVLIGQGKMPEDDLDHQNLIKISKEVLSIQLNYLNNDGLKWIYENHEKLISLSPEAKSFDRKVCHKLLQQEQMTPLEFGLLIKFIKQGLTISLTRDGAIIFEGKRHKLQGDHIHETLEKIAKTIIDQQQDIFTLQFQQHEPIFVKSDVEGGMKEAAVDIKEVRSISDKRYLLKNDFWVLTILRSVNNPQSDIILLEKRNAFGDHFIFRFNDQKVFQFYPNEMPELEEIFGSYIHGEAYQGELKELTKEVGQKLFESRDKNLISQIPGKVLSNQKYFHQELLGGGNEDRNNDIEQELSHKLNHYRLILEHKLVYLNSEAQKASIREYFDGFVSTFDTVYSSSKIIVAGQVEIKAGTDYFNLVNLFVQLLSLDPFGIGSLLAFGLDKVKKHFQDNKIINRALSIKELAPDHVELYDLANKTALDLIWHKDNTKHYDYTRVIFQAREDDPANNRFSSITRFVLEQFEKLKNFTKDYRLLRNAFLKEITKSPAWKLGSNDANKIIKLWIEFHDLHSNIQMDSHQKNEKIAEIAITSCFYINQQQILVGNPNRHQISSARQQSQFKKQQIPVSNINPKLNPSRKIKRSCSIF